MGVMYVPLLAFPALVALKEQFDILRDITKLSGGVLNHISLVVALERV